jgi:opacity protein-like surface antigen
MIAAGQDQIRGRGFVMRRLLLAVALMGLVADASAGEFEMPVLRGSSSDFAPSPWVPAPPTYTRWSGFYAGGQVSGTIAAMDFGTSARSLVSFATRNSVLENHVTSWTSLPKGDTSATGFGGFVGYNFQWDDVTLGVEANYTRSTLRKSASDSLSRSFVDNTNAPTGHEYEYHATVDANASVTLTDFGTFRARGGWAAGNFMPYGFAGLAVARANVTRSATVTGSITDRWSEGTVGGVDPVTGTPIILLTPRSNEIPLAPATQTEGQTGAFSFGYTAGFGMDVLLMANLFVRGEYEYVQFPNIKGTKINLNTLRFGGGLKF